MKRIFCDVCGREMSVSAHDEDLLHFCEYCIIHLPDECEKVRNS